MLNAAQEQFGSNPFAELVGSSNSGQQTQGTEVRDPLPNPWAPRQTGSGSNPPNSSGVPNLQQSTPASNPGLGTSGVFSSPGMQGLLQQITSNPQLMQSTLTSPFFQNVMQTMTQVHIHIMLYELLSV